MKLTPTLKEAKRLYDMGFAIHWLKPKSKAPVESGWTTGPRKKWDYLKETYFDGLNIGVRLGTPSKIKGHYLAVVDVDIKSKDKRHFQEAIKAARDVLGTKGDSTSIVVSGRGNGSRHYYVLTKSPFKTINPAASSEFVKVYMPSKNPSKKELSELSEKEIKDGYRISRAWEISLYSDGRQVVLPPSIHPDSGEQYRWKKHLESFEDLQVVSFNAVTVEAMEPDVDGNTYRNGQGQGSVREADKTTERSGVVTLQNFAIEPVDLTWLPISDDVRDAIIDGKGVEDRSGYLLKASNALLSAGLTQNEVLSVLTDPDTFLGACGYDHAKTRNRQRAAEWIYKYTFKKVSDEKDATRVFKKVSEYEPERELTPEEIEKQNEEFREERNWRQDIERTGNGEGPPKGTVKNVVLILKNAIAPDVIVRDEFAYRDAFGVDTPWGGLKDAALTDDDVTSIKYWLSETFNFEPKNQVIQDAMIVIALENTFDPVRDTLDVLDPWDGKKRLDTWLKKNFQAKGDDEYLAQVFRKWIVAMVVRTYKPGAKFDWMPIFEGAQGIGKSSFGRLLVGDKYFLDWLPNLADKDSALALQGMWAVEMGELSQFRKNELEVIKGFVTRTIDKMRPPYGRKWIESPRRCVFFGTTNRETYLRDDSGNRRFKPVKVGSLDFKALKRDRHQLFAEAKYLFDNKIETERTLELDEKAKAYERQIHAEKLVEDESSVMHEILKDFIAKNQAEKEVNFNFLKFRLHDLFSGTGPLLRWQLNQRNTFFASKALKMLGGQNFKSDGNKFWKLPGTGHQEGCPSEDFY